MNVYVARDYAGCKRTRRSTNGGLAMLGEHVIKSWASTQIVVALSSGDAEYYCVIKGVCEALSIVGLIADLGGPRMDVRST